MIVYYHQSGFRSGFYYLFHFATVTHNSLGLHTFVVIKQLDNLFSDFNWYCPILRNYILASFMR